MMQPEPPAWPEISVVRAALEGIATVFKSESGHPAIGIRSRAPWIFWLRKGLVVCERCSTGLGNPDPIKVDSAPPGSPIIPNSPTVYAQHLLLTTLYPFYREHLACGEPLESAPAAELQEAM